MATLPADPNQPATKNVAARLAERFPRQAEEQTARIRGGQIVQAQQAARQMQEQGSLPSNQQVAQVGAQAAGQAAQSAAQTAATGQQQATQAAQLGQQATAREQQGILAERELAGQQEARSAENRLANLNQQLKQELYDDRIAFESSEIGRGAMNESQLVDWAATNAKNQEDLADKLQTMELAQDRKLKFLEMGYKKISQELDQASKSKIQTMTYEKKVELMNAKEAFKRAYAREQARKANRAMVVSTVTGLIGAGVAGYASGGNPEAVKAGYGVGSGVGTAGAAAAEG